jgi:hypothetical protein
VAAVSAVNGGRGGRAVSGVGMIVTFEGEGGAMADAPDFRCQAAWLTGTAGKSTSVPNTSLM